MAGIGIENERDSDPVDLVAKSLMPGRGDPLRRLFHMHGAREPSVIWSPRPEHLAHSALQRFRNVCETMRGKDGLLRARDFDLERFGGLQDWMMLVAPDPEGYRYLHYGAGIADHYGRDMTGRTTADIGGHIQRFFEAVYKAAEKLLEPVLTEHEPPASVFVRSWRRLIVPFTDESGKTVDFFAVINLPENELRAGLDLVADPVFVLDADRVVHYANVAARRSFALAAGRPPGPTLAQLTGIDLGRLPPPETLFTDDRLDERVELSLDAGVTERRRITVSAAAHRRRLFYVVVIRSLDV